MKATPWILLALAILVIIWMNPCTPEATVDTHVVDSLNRSHDSTMRVYRDSINTLRTAVLANDSERNAQVEVKEQIEQRMTNKIAQLTFSLAKYRTAKEGRDTVGQLVNCSEIVAELDSVYQTALNYKAVIDSLTSNGQSRRQIDSAGIAIRDSTISQLQGQYRSAAQLLSDAMKDNADLRSALARSKRGRWLYAAIGVVIGGLIGHGVK